MPPRYEDFFLTVNGTVAKYTVEARGPGEISVPPMSFDYHETDELRLELNRIAAGFAPSRERMQSVGQLLFDALFPRKVIRAFERAHCALPEGVHLRLKLIVRPPELSHLSWELLYDPDDGVFLAARLSYPIVRFIESGKAVAGLLARRPLRVLYVQANPPDTNPLDTQTANEKALQQALGEHAEITPVRNATQAILQYRLREPFHILYHDGHAAFEVESDAGHLILHDGLLSGEMLGTYLDNTTVRLVVLSACETATDSKEKRFSGIAQELMHNSRLPAVVAMQYDIPEHSAAAFTTEFFMALADEYPVDAATIEGRKAILRELEDDPFAAPDWATPVLFMRVKDGDILRDKIEEDSAMGEKKESISTHIDTGGGANIGGDVNIGEGDFVGRDKVVHGDEVHGDKVGGDKIEVGDVSGTGIAIGRGAQANVTTGDAGQDLDDLFASLMEVLHAAPAEKQDQATQKAETLKSEVAKGQDADDEIVAGLIQDLVDLVPGAVSAVVSTFASPILGGLAGPFTNFVLKRIQRKQ